MLAPLSLPLAFPRRLVLTIDQASAVALIGLIAGTLGGTAGIGGGFLPVPLLQLVCNLRLKNAIATSAAVLCVSAGVGAMLKLVTLSQIDQSIARALTLAGCMVPAAMLGGWLGAKRVHRMSVGMVRPVMTALILIAATKLL